MMIETRRDDSDILNVIIYHPGLPQPLTFRRRRRDRPGQYRMVGALPLRDVPLEYRYSTAEECREFIEDSRQQGHRIEWRVQ